MYTARIKSGPVSRLTGRLAYSLDKEKRPGFHRTVSTRSVETAPAEGMASIAPGVAPGNKGDGSRFLPPDSGQDKTDDTPRPQWAADEARNVGTRRLRLCRVSCHEALTPNDFSPLRKGGDCPSAPLPPTSGGMTRLKRRSNDNEEVPMKRLLVCQRDPDCEWSRIAEADDPRASEAQAKHHAVHDRITAAREARKLQKTRLAARAERGGEGSAAPAARTLRCACYELGLFGDHGKGHVLAVRA